MNPPISCILLQPNFSFSQSLMTFVRPCINMVLEFMLSWQILEPADLDLVRKVNIKHIPNQIFTFASVPYICIAYVKNISSGTCHVLSLGPLQLYRCESALDVRSDTNSWELRPLENDKHLQIRRRTIWRGRHGCALTVTLQALLETLQFFMAKKIHHLIINMFLQP